MRRAKECQCSTIGMQTFCVALSAVQLFNSEGFILFHFSVDSQSLPKTAILTRYLLFRSKLSRSLFATLRRFGTAHVRTLTSLLWVIIEKFKNQISCH